MKNVVFNKKATHNYFILSTYEAGVVLKGSEVKSIREGGLSLNDSFVMIRKGEVFLKNAYIKPYSKTATFVPDTRQDRKLLLHKEEIDKLSAKVSQKGFTLVPTKAYFSGSLVKVEIGLAKGKQLFDKKETLKEKDIIRDVLRQTKLN